jgi:hypothetical protein
VRAAGGTLRDIDDADWEHLPDLAGGRCRKDRDGVCRHILKRARTAEAAWRHEVARLDAQPG